MYSDRIPDEIKKMMQEHFDIGLNLIEKKLKKIKIYCILRADRELKHICEEIYNLLCVGRRGIIRLKTLELLNYISSIDFSFEDKYQVFSRDCIEKTKSIRDYMIDNLSKKVTIDHICKKFDITATLFKKCFKELYQYPPHEYLNRIKMARAAELLVSTNMNILEVSVEIGCSSSSNFTRAFREIYRVSPLQYRKNQIKL
ncbi:helix-turn-helix transcriptional regulator [Clostridium sp.]|uniref:helix-turn-helix transcriptional regulator n=1 Tax=Clostridium sp. TaxID=1506 RepID=UPI0025C4EA61|nr:helix-turn-helix transcriptional regulator [Clostridium sp.]MCI1714949.1 helix-turn-helix transcriptional regulator [Clostridium sp.]MCI1799211.1 helix-turn-helix transcriptional regulator [Clostridium sp.]MCI1813132.1 helix-turn-helix transcriptional regulator [Clostridium sp.]MCI2200977.1 helix-turn-helix transcriptional regulator [Clostridium sp.]